MLYDHNGAKIEIHNRKIAEKYPNIWKLNKVFLINPYIKEQVTWLFKKYIELHENENTPYQSLWDTTKAVWRGKCIPLNAQIRKEGTFQSNNLSSQLTKLEK